MDKHITFEVTGSVASYALLLEKQEDGSRQKMKYNPHTFICEEGKKYDYLFKTTGKVGSTYEIEITGATSANTPIARTITSTQKIDDYSDELTA